VFAALTPSLAGIEPLVAWLQQRGGLRRAHAVVVTIAACWVVGIRCCPSMSGLTGGRSAECPCSRT
jgi:SNF family Na+-dependent transporter